MKKIGAAIFSVIMLFSSTPLVSANSEADEVLDNGNFGVDWFLKSNGTLVLEEGQLQTAENRTYPWTQYSDEIEKVTINGEIILSEQPFLFKGLKQLEVIENIDQINISEVKDLSYMFYQTESLDSLDLSSWDVSNVTNMNHMFDGATNLEYLDLSNWDISNVVTMETFINAEMNIDILKLQNWDEMNKEKIDSLFEKDESLNEAVLFSVSKLSNDLDEKKQVELATDKSGKSEKEAIIEEAVLDGWHLENNEWSYYDKNTKSVGWIEINGTWYYLDSNGVMATGWIKVNNNWYYLNSSGSMATGWVKTDNQWYYLKNDGAMVTGSYMIKNKSNIFSSRGAWRGQWEQNSTGWWFVYPNNQYPTNHWEKLNDKWYYFDNEGYMVTGWKLVNNHWYYMNHNGEMQTGWLLFNNEWYYLDELGAMQTDWIDLNGTLYFLDSTGKWLPEGRRMVVYLDPGHGSGDTGAYYGGIAERDINLEVSNKIASGLRELGYEVIMSRTTSSNSFSTNSREDLFARAEDANKAGADIFVSVHHNALPKNTSASGIETFYYGVNETYPPLPENMDSHNDPTRINNSKKLATLIHKELINSTKVNDRGIKTGAFVVTRETRMPAALLELGFMSNAAELKKLTTDAYQVKLADSVIAGIHNYFN